MPEVRIDTPAKRAQGVYSGMHPRMIDGGVEVISEPDDLTEGKGNFTHIGEDGNPEGFELIQLPVLASHDIYMGSSQNKTTQQNTVPLPLEQGYLVNGPLADGEVEPDELLIASLPKPDPPVINVRQAAVAGYPASSNAHPYYLALTGYRGGKHTALGPAVQLPPLAQGQSFRATVPDKAPLGYTHWGWWLSQPGLSSPTQTGQMRLQKLTLVGAFQGEISFEGPYLYDLTRPSDTALDAPTAPTVKITREAFPLRMGFHYFLITAANELGESLPSANNSVFVAADARYNDDQGNVRAGVGRIRITRGALPVGSTGWYCYAIVGNSVGRVFDKRTGEGLSRPWSLSRQQIVTGAWTGSEEFAQNEVVLVGSGDLPSENTTGIAAPDFAPEVISVYGATRPGPGRYYAKQRDRSSDGDLSPLSDAAYADVEEDEVMEVIPSSPKNKLPNRSFVSKGADGLPLGYTVLSGLNVTMEENELVMRGSGDGVVATDAIRVDVTKEWSVGARIQVDLPESGAFGGTFEVVLRQITAGAVQTDTVLDSISATGQKTYYTSIAVAGLGAETGALDWNSDTLDAQIVYRFSGGGTRNMTVRISDPVLSDFAYSFTANPLGGAQILPADSVPTSPETSAQAAPHRPTSAGTVLDAQEFAGSVPWTQDVTGGASLSTSGGKLVAAKAAGGSLSRAAIKNTFAVDAGLTARHALGACAEEVTFPTLPTNGSVTFLELRRPSDGARYAWADVDTRREVARLRINSAPSQSGDVTLTLDEGGTPTTRTASLVATKEKATLAVRGVPTANGVMKVSAGAVTKEVPVTTGTTGYPEITTVEIVRGASATGMVGMSLRGPSPASTVISFCLAVVLAGDSPEVIANKLRAYANDPRWQNEPWLISGQGRFITFTSKYPAPTNGGHLFYPAMSVSGGFQHTHVEARFTITQAGIQPTEADTAASIAAKVERIFSSVLSTARTDSDVTLEALSPGVTVDASVDAGTTGISATMSTTTQGALDSAEDVATKIAALYAGNTYHAVTQSGALLTISALSSGAKQDATFSAGSTGLDAELQTIVQGSSDIVVYAQDQYGTLRQRRIFTGVTTAGVYNVELSSSGSGYPPEDASYNDSKAVLQIWASTGTDAKVLMGLFEGIDLGGYPAGMVAAGATSESSSALTWDVRIERLRVTDLGDTHYRYHDYRGVLLNRLRLSFPPNLLPTEGYGITGYKMAVLPSTQYTASIFTWWREVSGEGSEPLYLWAVTSDDEIREIGDLTGGMSGATEWHETTPLTFTTPANCYELWLGSKTVSGGELVAQELCISRGASVAGKRTSLYATAGTYMTSMYLGQRYLKPGMHFSGRRSALACEVDTPPSTSVDISYEARNLDTEGYDAAVTDPALVAQKPDVRVTVLAYSDGVRPVVVHSGSPGAEYVFLLHGVAVATLLTPERAELDGGIICTALERPAEPPEIAFTPLPGGRIAKMPTFPPTGNVSEFQIHAFTPEAKEWLENRAALVGCTMEARGNVLELNLSGHIRLASGEPEREADGKLYGYYTGKVPASSVLERRPLPG